MSRSNSSILWRALFFGVFSVACALLIDYSPLSSTSGLFYFSLAGFFAVISASLDLVERKLAEKKQKLEPVQAKNTKDLALGEPKAEKAQKDFDFMLQASRALRQPTALIRGELEILNQEIADVLDEEQAKLLKQLTVSAHRLHNQVTNIASACECEDDRPKLYIACANPVEIINQVQAELTLRATTQGRLLNFDIDKNLANVAVDAEAVAEILTNLVDNAIKYSREGGSVDVKARQKGDFVEISVKDYGVGMSSSVMDQLFTKFYRSQRARQSGNGLGLSLYLAKRVIEAHGGYISASSSSGEGSEFRFGLPNFTSVADKIKNYTDSDSKHLKNRDGWRRKGRVS